MKKIIRQAEDYLLCRRPWLLIYKMFVECDVPIDADIAMCLYTGIATDTGFFRFNNTTHSALSISAELMRLSAKPALIADAVATKSFRELQLMSAAMQTIELFLDGKAIGIFLDETLSKLASTDDLIDMIRFADGVDIAFLLRYESRGRYRLRMRSRQTDITTITASLGGGGHKNAAGATLKDTLEEVKMIVINAIVRAFKL